MLATVCVGEVARDLALIQGTMPHSRSCSVRVRASLRWIGVCVLGACLSSSSCRAVEDVCAGSGVRPVLLIPGFQSSPLYDSSNKYDIEWPDFDAFGRSYGPGALDVDLPMQWNGLEQAPTPVGPKRKANDNLPGLDGFWGNIFEFAVRSFARCLCIVRACDCPSARSNLYTRFRPVHVQGALVR